jgi:hypothetical protein
VPTSDARGDVFYGGHLACSRVRTIGVGPRPRGAIVGDRHPREGLAEGPAEGFAKPSGSLKGIAWFFDVFCTTGPFYDGQRFVPS